MRAGIVAWVIGLALLVSGCDPVLDRRYVNEGAGVDLYTADRASQVELLRAYESFLCAQLGPGCGNDWGTFVLAGMNDIDQRCDGFLTWLDARRRDREPILAEISAINTAVHSIMTVTGSSPKSLDIVTMAFGLASATYANWNSRLLISANQSTVQEVVYKGQGDFRAQIKTYRVPDQPTAIYLLRNYLRLCMPITIEASINTTTTLVLRDAPNAARKNLVVSTMPTSGGGVAFTPRQQFGGREQQPTTRIEVIPGAETVIAGYPGNKGTYTPEVIESILVGLCAPATERKKITPVTKALLEIWEQTDTADATANGKIDGKRERQAIVGLPECPNNIRNSFERQTFANVDGSLKSTKILTDLLDRAPPAPDGSGLLGSAVPLASARARIAQLRRDCFAGLKKLPGTMNEQVTQDFMEALRAYDKKRAAAPAPAAGQPVTLPSCQ